MCSMCVATFKGDFTSIDPSSQPLFGTSENPARLKGAAQLQSPVALMRRTTPSGDSFFPPVAGSIGHRLQWPIHAPDSAVTYPRCTFTLAPPVLSDDCWR